MKYRIDRITLNGARGRGEHKYYYSLRVAQNAAAKMRMYDFEAHYEVVELETPIKKWFVHYSYDRDEWSVGDDVCGEREFVGEVYARCELDAIDEGKRILSICLEDALMKEGIL